MLRGRHAAQGDGRGRRDGVSLAGGGLRRRRRTRAIRAIDADEARDCWGAAEAVGLGQDCSRPSPRGLAPRACPASRRSTSASRCSGLREDGYHELRTLFQTIDLHDDIVLRPRPRGRDACAATTRWCPRTGPTWPLRAAAGAARATARVEAGVEIEITKRIPVGGRARRGQQQRRRRARWGSTGCGGSAWVRPACIRLARRLGADVPYLPAGRDRPGPRPGRRGLPAAPPDPGPRGASWTAGFPVSTAAVFARLDASLTPRENSNSIFRFVSSDLEGKQRPAAPVQRPRAGGPGGGSRPCARGRSASGACWSGAGARLASLSGSGSSYFGLFDDAASGAARRGRSASPRASAPSWRGRSPWTSTGGPGPGRWVR